MEASSRDDMVRNGVVREERLRIEGTHARNPRNKSSRFARRHKYLLDLPPANPNLRGFSQRGVGKTELIIQPPKAGFGEFACSQLSLSSGAASAKRASIIQPHVWLDRKSNPLGGWFVALFRALSSTFSSLALAAASHPPCQLAPHAPNKRHHLVLRRMARHRVSATWPLVRYAG